MKYSLFLLLTASLLSSCAFKKEDINDLEQSSFNTSLTAILDADFDGIDDKAEVIYGRSNEIFNLPSFNVIDSQFVIFDQEDIVLKDAILLSFDTTNNLSPELLRSGLNGYRAIHNNESRNKDISTTNLLSITLPKLFDSQVIYLKSMINSDKQLSLKFSGKLEAWNVLFTKEINNIKYELGYLDEQFNFVSLKKTGVLQDKFLTISTLSKQPLLNSGISSDFLISFSLDNEDLDALISHKLVLRITDYDFTTISGTHRLSEQISRASLGKSFVYYNGNKEISGLAFNSNTPKALLTKLKVPFHLDNNGNITSIDEINNTSTFPLNLKDSSNTYLSKGYWYVLSGNGGMNEVAPNSLRVLYLNNAAINSSNIVILDSKEGETIPGGEHNIDLAKIGANSDLEITGLKRIPVESSPFPIVASTRECGRVTRDTDSYTCNSYSCTAFATNISFTPSPLTLLDNTRSGRFSNIQISTRSGVSFFEITPNSSIFSGGAVGRIANRPELIMLRFHGSDSVNDSLSNGVMIGSIVRSENVTVAHGTTSEGDCNQVKGNWWGSPSTKSFDSAPPRTSSVVDVLDYYKLKSKISF